MAMTTDGGPAMTPIRNNAPSIPLTFSDAGSPANRPTLLSAGRQASAASEPIGTTAVGERSQTIGSFDRVANIIVTALPVLLAGVAARMAWGGALHWQDLVVLAVTYLLTGIGVTVGFHRLLTHRSFKTSPPLRAVLAALGSAAIEGPVIEWVANHRKHHRFSDQPGDPHSPHVEHGTGWRGALGGLFPAHVG